MFSGKTIVKRLSVISAAGLVTGMLLALAVMAGSAFAAEDSSVTDGRDVEVMYLNDVLPDEELEMESTVTEGTVYAASNLTDIDSLMIRGVEDQPWTGNPVTLPKLEIWYYRYPDFYYYDSSYYTTTYTNNINPGTASVTITGNELNNGISGSITKSFKIIPPTINDETAVIEGVLDKSWTGNPVTLSGLSVKVKSGEDIYTLTEGTDYTVTYADNVDPGRASVTITGMYENGSVIKTFRIINDEPVTEPPTETPETPDSGTPSETPETPEIVIPKGTTTILGSGASKATFTVTGTDTMAFTKSKTGKNAASVVVPDTVTFAGKTYQVTSIGKKAFSGMKKLKKVTIGPNVTSIGANAFAKCPKLKTLIVESTVLKPAKCKQCLKGSSVKTVKVPKSVKKTYKKKIFTKKVCGRSVKVK